MREYCVKRAKHIAQSGLSMYLAVGSARFCRSWIISKADDN